MNDVVVLDSCSLFLVIRTFLEFLRLRTLYCACICVSDSILPPLWPGGTVHGQPPSF